MNKLIITAALTGAEVTKKDNPKLPVAPEEIAAAAYQCWQAGASIVHLHARYPDGTPTQDKKIYKKIIEMVKQECDLIIQVSTGGAVGMTAEERIAPVTLSPEMATLTTGSVNFGEGVFYNSPEDIEYFAMHMKQYGVKPEIEVFEIGMVETANRMVNKGLINRPLHFDFVMGVPGAIPGTLKNLINFVETIPAGSTWSVAGIGRTELPLAIMGIILGGHVRVGFEDNIYYKKGVPAKSNAQLVERIARISRELGREVANPVEAREILGIS